MNRKESIEHFIKLVLRAVPFFPVPELYDLARALTKSQVELDVQIEEAVGSLKKSANLITSLETEMKKRATKLAQLQEEHKQLAALSAVSAEQVQALAIQVEQAIGKSKRWDVPLALVVNLFAGLLIFVFGILASDWVRHVLHIGKP